MDVPLQYSSPGGSGSGGVSSFTGDGTILSNSGSTGAVTAALANAAADTVLANATGSSAAPTYTTNPVVKSLTLTDTGNNTDLIVQNTTTATSGTTNASPLAEFQANYWTGAASAADNWTVGSSLASGTNGASTLTIAHNGSSGAAAVKAPAFTPTVVAPASGFGLYGNAQNLAVLGNTSSSWIFQVLNVNGAGQWAVGYSGGYFVGHTANLPLTWSSSNSNPGTTNDTSISRVSAGVLGIGKSLTVGDVSGSLECSNIALNGNTLQAAGTINAGTYYSGGTAGITQVAEAVGTLATIGGIVTTFTAVSDERLKVFSEYEGGLNTVLAINPIKFRWNADGAKISGQKTDRDFVGFSAQNVNQVIPEAIHTTREGYLGFDDRPVIAALVNSTKELNAQIKASRAEADKTAIKLADDVSKYVGIAEHLADAVEVFKSDAENFKADAAKREQELIARIAELEISFIARFWRWIKSLRAQH